MKVAPTSPECTSAAGRLSPALEIAAEAALDALRVDPERSRAGLLCVAAGMAVIVALASIVSGGRREMLRAVEAAGPSNVYLKTERKAGAPAAAPLLTTADLGVTASRLPSLAAAAGVRVRTVELAAGALRIPAPVYGATAGIGDVFPLRAARGRGLGPFDFARKTRCAVLGAGLAGLLAPGGDPVGRSVELAGEPYEVVGVLAPLSADAGSGGDLVGVDWDRGLLLPLGAEPGSASAPDEDAPIDLAVLRFADPREAGRAARLVKLLREEHGEAGGVAVTTPAQALEQYRAAHRSFDRVALLVSILSTASAAFGITNLLRASVKARASEIGVRRAVGARQEDIRGQFLLEGLFLGVGGGVLGILLGILASLTLLSHAGWRPAFDAASLLLLTLGSAGFGIATGLKPAADAARLDPGVALRIE